MVIDLDLTYLGFENMSMPAIKKILKPLVPPLANALVRCILPFKSRVISINPEESLAKLNSVWPRKEVVVDVHNEIPSSPTKDLTIIIPIYNVEKYLEECLNSIISQKTKYSFSVIAIDDGSTDKSPQILDEFAKKDKRIIAIHQPNGGIARARNAGLKHIDGRYIMFVDSDDVLAIDAIETLISIADAHDADIVEGQFRGFQRKYQPIGEKEDPSIEVLSDGSSIKGFPFAKVIRSSLFEDIVYPEGIDFEDSIFAYCINPMARKAIATNKVVYGYRNNAAGITHTIGAKPKSLDTIYVSLALWEWRFKRFGPSLAFQKQALHQIALNYHRLIKIEEKTLVEEAAFSVQREAYLKMFKESPKKGWKYKKLDQALRKGDYGKYETICARWFII